MTCYCDYDSSPSMHSEVWHKAKKEHKCCECGQAIKAGQQYQRISGVWDGDFSSYKTCERCADLREALSEVSCPTYRGLSEEYFNYLDSWLLAEKRDETYRRVFPVTPNAKLTGSALLRSPR